MSTIHDPPRNGDQRAESRLLPHHRQQLEASGLTVETILAAGIHSESRSENLAALLGRRPSRNLVPAIVFPFYDADGNNGYVRTGPTGRRSSAANRRNTCRPSANRIKSTSHPLSPTCFSSRRSSC